VGNLLSTLFRVVHRHLGSLFGACTDGLAHIFSGSFGEVESFFGSIRSLHHHSFCATIHFDDRSLSHFYAALADLADFYARFVKTFAGGVSDDFRAFLEAVQSFFRSRVGCIACDLDGVCGSIRGLNDNGLRGLVHFCHGSMDDAHHVLCDANHCRENGANYQNPELSHHQFSFNDLSIVTALRGRKPESTPTSLF
jgi:hypothetical protein